jgi:hypothetical protein
MSPTDSPIIRPSPSPVNPPELNLGPVASMQSLSVYASKTPSPMPFSSILSPTDNTIRVIADILNRKKK